MRRDGKCAGCGTARKITAEAKKYAGANLERDPWCSSKCAREFHGTELPPTAQGDRRRVPVCGENSGYQSGCKCAECLAYVRDRQRLVRANRMAAA